MFVGDLYASEIELLGKLLDEVSDLDAVLLVSYGGMAPPKHGVRYRDQVSYSQLKSGVCDGGSNARAD